MDDVTTLHSPVTLPRAPSVRPAHADTVRWLVDNAAAYDALLDALDGARRSVWMSQLAFDADCIAFGDERTGDGDRRLVDAVRAAADRGVDVRILLNASLLLDTAAPLRAFLRESGVRGVQVRGIGRFPQLLHAKLAIVDGERALVLGSPFVNGYWDTSDHVPVDARRPERELGGRPLHDLSFAVTGRPVAPLARAFAELWNDVSVGDTPLRRIVAPRARDDDDAGALRVVRTAPRRVLPAHPDGLAEILPAIEDGLSRARSLVYIEHQYLSARPVVAALAAALAREPALEVIVVLNQNPDVTAYRVWQNTRLRDAGLLDHPRVGLFALWTARRAREAQGATVHDVNQVFVHSKVVVVDDRWATVGSANLDGVSLHSYGDDFASWAGQRIFRHVRNFDVNLVVDDAHAAADGVARDLRLRLWSEQLGAPVDELAERPDGGWVAWWRERAARNVAALSGLDRAPDWRGFILPYSTCATPAAQLADVGVAMEHVALHFDPGWLEVHCSPNWVRNMFA